MLGSASQYRSHQSQTLELSHPGRLGRGRAVRAQPLAVPIRTSTPEEVTPISFPKNLDPFKG